MVLIHNSRPVEPLLKLAQRHGIRTYPDMPVQILVHKLKKYWGRPCAHQYQIKGDPPDTEDAALLEQMGMLEPIQPPLEKCEGALVLGATLPRVRERLVFLQDLYNAGLQVRDVYLLGGQRPLDLTLEGKEALYTPLKFFFDPNLVKLGFKEEWSPPDRLPNTEAEMMQYVFDQSLLPTEWRSILINTPLQSTDGKTFRSPNTPDTIKVFLDTNPPPGRYVVITSQPFVARQRMDILRHIPAERGIEVIVGGHFPAPNTPLRVFLDEVVRLFQAELAVA